MVPDAYSISLFVTSFQLAYHMAVNRWRIYAELSAAALAFVAAVLIGLWLGQWLDAAIGTSPLFTLVLMSLALLGAVVNLVKTLKRVNGSY